MVTDLPKRCVVSCIEPGLVIHFLYDIMHVSMPFSQIIPPFSHRVQKTVLYIDNVFKNVFTKRIRALLCSTYRHTQFYCASLYCASQILHFSQIKSLWQSCTQQVIGTILHLPTAFSHSMSLHHILVMLIIFQTFSFLLYWFW